MGSVVYRTAAAGANWVRKATDSPVGLRLPVAIRFGVSQLRVELEGASGGILVVKSPLNASWSGIHDRRFAHGFSLSPAGMNMATHHKTG